MDDFLNDLRHSVRMFLKSPGFSMIAVAAVALGIGANTAIFSIVNTVLFEPLPVSDPDHLVALGTTRASSSASTSGLQWAASPTRLMHWRSQSSVLQDVSAFFPRTMNYTGGEAAEQWRAMQVSADVFRCWRTPILLGRAFAQDEDIPNSRGVVMMSWNRWTRRFASDPRILSKTISLNGEPYSVIGVVAENQILREFGPPPDLYVPFQLDPNSRDEGMYFSAVARLKPGVTLDQARERLRTSTGAYRSRFPNDLGPRESFSVVSFREALIGDTRRPLLVLMGAVTLVLLIACTNVANLLLVRVTGRRREIAIRAAMGADRGRIIRQLLTHSALLSLAGGAMGLWLGYGGIRALLAVNTADLPLVGTNGTAVEMDWRMVGFALAVSLATGIVFGLLPAIQGSRADLNSILKGGMGAGALRQSNASAVLVVSEVGLAVTLLVGSALLIRTLAALYAVDRGFDTNHVVTMRMALTGTKYSKSRAVADTIREGLEHIRLLPGVVNASATCCLPLQDGTYDENFDIVGRARTDHREVGWAAVSPGFFEIFRMPVKTSERVRQEGFADNL